MNGKPLLLWLMVYSDRLGETSMALKLLFSRLRHPPESKDSNSYSFQAQKRAIFLVAIMIASVMVVSFPVSANDSDGDTIPDVLDQCPYSWGNATSVDGEGCLDSDGDGQADWETGVIKAWPSASSEYYNSVGSTARAVAWNPDGASYASGGSAGTLEIFDVPGNTLAVLANFNDDIRDLDYSADGSMICASGENAEAYVLDSTSGNIIYNLSTAHFIENDVHACHFSNDGLYVFTGGGDSAIYQYWMSNGTLHNNYSTNGTVYDIDTTPDGSLFVAGGGDSVSLHHAHNGTEINSFWNTSETILSVEFTPTGRDFISGSADNYWRAYGILNQTLFASGNGGTDVYDIQFSSDSSTMIIARGSRSSLYYYDVQDNYSYIGDFGSFGSGWSNRGTRDLAIHPDDAMLLIASRRGRTYLYVEPSGYLQIHGDWTVDIMEPHWKNSWPGDGRILDHVNSTTFESTQFLCDNDGSIAALTEGHNPIWVDQDPNFSTNGRVDCKGTGKSLIEFPIGNVAGAFAVKAGGNTQTCIETLGGLSIGQLRWMISSKSSSELQNSVEYPGLEMSSVAKDDDGDQFREWSDLDNSCDESEIILVHRWENRSEVGMLKEQFLCNHCVEKDSLYPNTNERPRDTFGLQNEVIDSLTGPSSETLIAFSELEYLMDYNNGTYLVPIVNNWTHGAADALAEGVGSESSFGGYGVNSIVLPSSENVTNNSWPIKSYLRALIHEDDLGDKLNIANWFLTESAQMAMDSGGYTRLSVHDRVLSWARIGIDMSYLLPDNDLDGVWDGDDDCPNTDAGISVDAAGCADNQLDNDNDGVTNDIDDCVDEYGTATESPFIACLDSDGDGWADVDDAFSSDQSQWRDQDGDGFGDSTLNNATTPDDCPTIFGNSTMDRFGCVDSDSDGYSNADETNLAHPMGIADAFPDDSSQWRDTDSDGVGDNYTWSGATDARTDENGDAFPLESTQWHDQDGDGFGDNSSGFAADSCPTVPGSSTENGTRGCFDSDGDGWADTIDHLPSNQWQWLDSDGDTYGENLDGQYADWCPNTPPDEIDDVNFEGCGPSERDLDADGVSDNLDLCINTSPFEATKVDENGCAPSERDGDSDGVSEDIDFDDSDPTQSSDTDGDGYGDNITGNNGDQCPWRNGNSSKDRRGCIDSDGDGYSDPESIWTTDDGADLFTSEKTQWADYDEDGYGDNWGDSSWNDSRESGLPGEFIFGAKKADRCPTTNYIFADSNGCPPSANSGLGGNSNVDGTGSGNDGSSNTLLIIVVIAGVLLLGGLGFVIAILLRKPKSSAAKGRRKKKKRSKSSSKRKQSSSGEGGIKTEEKIQPEIVDTDAPSESPSDTEASFVDDPLASDVADGGSPQTVSSWEELPVGGEYTDPDSDGVVWYKDGTGIHWFQNADDSWSQWSD